MSEVERFGIKVVPSPETNDHEVVLSAGETNLVDRFSRDLMGLDPDEILTVKSQLRVTGESAQRALIGRCSCGVVGCGSVEVDIAREGELVTWKAVDGSTTVTFNSKQYDEELERALNDYSWESPDRTAARHLMSSLDRDALIKSGLKVEWASGRVGNGTFVVSLKLVSGAHQLLVAIPWDGTSVEVAVRDMTKVLAEPPSGWPDVRYYPQTSDKSFPAIAGPGWRLG